MKTIEQHKSLKAYNTFAVECFCEHFISVNTTEELRAALLNEDFSERFILGGGSNLLLTKNLSGLCIHVNLKGIRVIEEDDVHAIIEASAGENWHDFVLWTLDQGYGGLENLAITVPLFKSYSALPSKTSTVSPNKHSVSRGDVSVGSDFINTDELIMFM